MKPLLKKPTLDYEVFKNFRPISSLTFLSKLIERVIAEHLVSHMQANGMIEKFQSAYKVKYIVLRLHYSEFILICYFLLIRVEVVF